MRQILQSIIMMTLLLSATVAAGAARVEMINEMVPKNWILVYYTLGDINHDGKDDAIMVVENTDPYILLQRPSERALKIHSVFLA